MTIWRRWAALSRLDDGEFYKEKVLSIGIYLDFSSLLALCNGIVFLQRKVSMKKTYTLFSVLHVVSIKKNLIYIYYVCIYVHVCWLRNVIQIFKNFTWNKRKEKEKT